MTKKTTIAVLATIASIIAGPAFAGDQDVETELRDSGRYVPEVNEPADHYSPGIHHERYQVPAHGSDFRARER